jgi:cobalt/nickel transport system permease protein
MIVLTPLGLLAPGGAFGEDAPEDLNLGQLGLTAIPDGLANYTGYWKHTLLDGYGFAGGDNPVLGYVLSAVIGILVIGVTVLVFAAIARWVAGLIHRGSDESNSTSTPSDPAPANESASAAGGGSTP